MSQIERALEEERRIIAAAEGNWGNSAIGTDDRIEFIAHARTALPLRNAQVEMAWEIVELLEQSAPTARAAGYGQSDATWARMQGMAFAYDDARTALRRAIEEAGA